MAAVLRDLGFFYAVLHAHYPLRAALATSTISMGSASLLGIAVGQVWRLRAPSMNCPAYAQGKLSKRIQDQMSPGFPKGKLAPTWPESTQMTKQKSVAKYRVDRTGGHTSGLAGCLGAMFWATTHAADAIAHEMKNAVQGSRVVGAARIAGPQTRSVNRLIMPASALAATSGKIENNTPRPQAICPAPVR